METRTVVADAADEMMTVLLRHSRQDVEHAAPYVLLMSGAVLHDLPEPLAVLVAQTALLAGVGPDKAPEQNAAAVARFYERYPVDLVLVAALKTVLLNRKSDAARSALKVLGRHIGFAPKPLDAATQVRGGLLGLHAARNLLNKPHARSI
jgi:hypothetical protein